MSNLQISIRGYIVGAIWWPVGAECYKPLSYDITSEQARTVGKMTLRDHVLRATNDGDFQAATIALGEVVAERRTVSAGRVVTVRRSWPLSQFPSIADCLHADGDDWCPQCEDNDDFCTVEA